jgi:cytochrome c oxidase subunit 2
VGRKITARTTRLSRARRTGSLVLVALSLLVLTGCSDETTDQWKRLGLPPPASDRSPFVKDLWIGSWIAAFIIGGFVWGLILWASFRYRRRSDDELPSQVRYNLPIEVLYTIAPVIVVAVLFYFTVQKLDKVQADVENPDHTITVVAQRWSWTFDYLHEPSTGNENVYDTGTPESLPELWLVKDESVTFQLTSPDVIHSFWIPEFYFKLDIIPGRNDRSRQSFSMTPTTYGTFAGRCAELCGLYHSRMLFEVHVVTRSQFDQHMKDLQAAGQVGAPSGQKNADTVAGLSSSEGG